MVLDIDADSREIRHVIPVGSNNAHRIEVLPDGSKLYSENEEDGFASVVDPRTRKLIEEIPTANGWPASACHPTAPPLSWSTPWCRKILVVDPASDVITRTIALEGHAKAAQIARYSPDGRYLVVTSHDEPLVTIFTADLAAAQVRIGKGLMNMAFHPDGRTVLIGNQDDGTLPWSIWRMPRFWNGCGPAKGLGGAVVF